MKKTVKIGFTTISSGLSFIAVGVAMLLFQIGIEGMLIALPIALISIGGILAALGLIMFIGRIMARKGSDFAKEIADGDKEIDILESDERNIAISLMTSATTHKYMNLLNAPLLIFMMVMQVELVVTLVFLAVLMVRIIMYALLRYKYNKEM